MAIYHFESSATGHRRADEATITKRNEQENALWNILNTYGLSIRNLNVFFERGEATIVGEASDQETKEKAILAIGNLREVFVVNDQLTVTWTDTTGDVSDEEKAFFYEVQRDDTLATIAKAYYGDSLFWEHILEANRPILDDPEKIFPGMYLRLPRAVKRPATGETGGEAEASA